MIDLNVGFGLGGHVTSFQRSKRTQSQVPRTGCSGTVRYRCCLRRLQLTLSSPLPELTPSVAFLVRPACLTSSANPAPRPGSGIEETPSSSEHSTASRSDREAYRGLRASVAGMPSPRSTTASSSPVDL